MIILNFIHIRMNKMLKYHFNYIFPHHYKQYKVIANYDSKQYTMNDIYCLYTIFDLELV